VCSQAGDALPATPNDASDESDCSSMPLWWLQRKRPLAGRSVIPRIRRGGGAPRTRAAGHVKSLPGNALALR